jgi:hypothetical protein
VAVTVYGDWLLSTLWGEMLVRFSARAVLTAGIVAASLAVPAEAWAQAPSSANIRFKVPATVSSTDSLTATVPLVVYWIQGASTTQGVGCCSNNVSDYYNTLPGGTTTGTTFPVQPIGTGTALLFDIASYDSQGALVGTTSTDVVWPDGEQISQTLQIMDDSNFASSSYSGSWPTATGANFIGGTSRYSTRAGAAFSFATTFGRAAAWVTTTGPSHGSAKIYIDGAYLKTVSTYSKTLAYRRVVWQADWPAQFPPAHTIKIVNLGTAGHPKVSVDAIFGLQED